MADSTSDTSSRIIENTDSEIKEIELNEESTGFDVSESESPLAISDQSSSCLSFEQTAQTDTPSASVDEIIQSSDKPAIKVSDSGSSDCSGSILPESSNLSTVGDANIDETQISINSSISKVKHFTSFISPDQATATTSGVLKSDSVDSISQPGYGLSTGAEDFQAILISCLEESGSKNEGESSGDQAENPLERMGDSSTEDETQSSEAALIPGGSKKKKYTTLSIGDITSMVIKKTLHASSESSSSCSSPIDDKYRRKVFQRLKESSSSSSSNSSSSTSTESSLSDEARKEIRDRSDSYERAVTIGRWHQYVKERKEREEKSDSDTEETSGPAKRPALERKDKDDDDPPAPGFPEIPIPPQERLI